MTKQDIIDHLTNDCGLHRSSAISAVDGVINSISDALARGETVTLRGFAAFKPVEKAEKTVYGLNGNTPTVVPAHRTAKMTIYKELKEKLNA